MLWALHDAPCADPLDKLILLTMADAASDDGRNVYLAVQTIADTVPCDRATVQRHMRVLERAGLIVRGDQSAADVLRADRRPTVYDLPLPGRTVRPRPLLRGRTDPADGAARGAAPVRPEPKNQEMNQRQVAALEAGEPVGCADHGSRRPACDACLRAGTGLDMVKTADPHAWAAQVRAAMRRGA